MDDHVAAIQAVQQYISKANSDLYLYSGQIMYSPAAQFVDLICKRNKRKQNALLFLTTPGGDPDAAYRMIRSLRMHYTKVRLGVVGPCKSAGTLVALGAHEIVMAETRELGPLDVQLTKPDDLIPNSSGLDIFQALAVATQAAFGAFEQYMFNLIEHSFGNISTKTAAEIARDLAVGIYAPITSQIDPHRLGEVQRAIRIAQAYAEKLGQPNLKPKALETLVEGYPSHGFVIDYEESRKLFKLVSRLSDEEKAIAALFKPFLRHVMAETKFLDIGETFKDTNAATETDNEPKGNRKRRKPTVPKGTRGRKRNSRTTSRANPNRAVAIPSRGNGADHGPARR